MRAQNGQDLLTLITCTPYGINTHRLLVHAHRVPMDNDDLKLLEEVSGFKMQWWMWAVMAVATAVLALMTLWVYRQIRSSKHSEQGESDA